jgi:hypothetical protein
MQERQAKNGTKYHLASLAELEALSPLEPLTAGDKIRLGCPFHGSDKQRSLAVTLSKGSFKCYCCGTWGYLREGEPTPAAKIPPPQPVTQDRPDLRRLLEQLQVNLPGSPGEAYLVRRHIRLETARSCGLAYCPPGQWPGRVEARKWPRIVFPLEAPGGELVGLYSRSLDPEYPRVKAPKDIRHDIVGQRGLFNGCQALKRVRSQPSLYLTEGPFDCLAMLETGYASSVALVGIEGLPWDWFKEVSELYLCLDRDESGIAKAAQQAQEATLRGITAFIPGEDAYGGYPEPSEQYEATGQVTLESNHCNETQSEAAIQADENIQDVKEQTTSEEKAAHESVFDLLSWADDLAQKNLVLPEPITFTEAPLRPVTTGRVSYYAGHYRETISSAKFQQKLGGWGQWTPKWWQRREAEALFALTQLREALSNKQAGGQGHV